MKENTFTKISLIVSTVLFLSFLYLRVILFNQEASADGKSAGLFDINIIVVLYTTYIPIIIFGIAVMFSVIGSKRKESAKMVVGSFLLSFFVITIYYWPFLVRIL